MAELRISPRATEDLLDIWSYIADDSEANADGFIDKIHETMELLARQPGLGRQRKELVPGIQSLQLAGTSFSIESLAAQLKLSVFCTAHGISRIFSRAERSILVGRGRVARRNSIPQKSRAPHD